MVGTDWITDALGMSDGELLTMNGTCRDLSAGGVLRFENWGNDKIDGGQGRQ